MNRVETGRDSVEMASYIWLRDGVEPAKRRLRDKPLLYEMRNICTTLSPPPVKSSSTFPMLQPDVLLRL